MRWTQDNKQPKAGSSEQPLTVTAREAARLLGISERHLWTMLHDGRLGPQPMRFGRAVRWNRAEIEAWLSAGAPSRDDWQSSRNVKRDTA